MNDAVLKWFYCLVIPIAACLVAGHLIGKYLGDRDGRLRLLETKVLALEARQQVLTDAIVVLTAAPPGFPDPIHIPPQNLPVTPKEKP